MSFLYLFFKYSFHDSLLSKRAATYVFSSIRDIQLLTIQLQYTRGPPLVLRGEYNHFRLNRIDR